MLLLARAVGVLAWVSAAASLAAVIAATLGRHEFASRAARVTGVLALFAIGACLLAFGVLYVFARYSLRPPEWLISGVDPSDKARYLAESISELMNCSALLLVASLPGLCVLGFERWWR